MDILNKKSNMEERIEAKLDWIAEQLNSIEYSKIKKELEQKYPKK